jgi:hypothetical protein
VAGTVADAQTRKPVPNVRVEAWNNDTPQHAVLDAATTDATGRFQLVIETEVGAVGPGGTVINVVPAVLKVFQNNQMLQATGDTSIPNLLAFDRAAILQVQPVAPKTVATDRITAPQALMALNFVQRSDFAGVFREGRDRASSLGTILMDSFKSAVTSVALKPIHPSAVRNRDVINQDPKTATQRLQEQNIAVGQVVPYQPGLVTAFTAATSLPKTLKPGDKVNLLVQDGVVRGYQIVTPPKTASPGTEGLTTEVNALNANVQLLQTKTDDLEQFKASQQATAAATSGEITALQQKAALVDQLQTQLARVQQDSAQKDQTISALQKQVTDVQAAHNALATQLTPARIAALEDAVRKLQGSH